MPKCLTNSNIKYLRHCHGFCISKTFDKWQEEASIINVYLFMHLFLVLIFQFDSEMFPSKSLIQAYAKMLSELKSQIFTSLVDFALNKIFRREIHRYNNFCIFAWKLETECAQPTEHLLKGMFYITQIVYSYLVLHNR